MTPQFRGIFRSANVAAELPCSIAQKRRRVSFKGLSYDTPRGWPRNSLAGADEMLMPRVRRGGVHRGQRHAIRARPDDFQLCR